CLNVNGKFMMLGGPGKQQYESICYIVNTTHFYTLLRKFLCAVRCFDSLINCKYEFIKIKLAEWYFLLF
ncbi:MAG: hypothetical protein WBE68_18320, partial [Candidatus Nitrosopolaris sp.]